MLFVEDMEILVSTANGSTLVYCTIGKLLTNWKVCVLGLLALYFARKHDIYSSQPLECILRISGSLLCCQACFAGGAHF
jgi:hypothetical protein